MVKLLGIIIAIVAIVTVCTALTDEQKAKALKHAEKCTDQIGVMRGDVLKMLNGDFTVTDTKIECFARCFFELAGLMNAEGVFLEAVAVEKLSMNADKARVEALVNTCKLEMGANPCETAYKIYKCYRNSPLVA